MQMHHVVLRGQIKSDFSPLGLIGRIKLDNHLFSLLFLFLSFLFSFFFWAMLCQLEMHETQWEETTKRSESRCETAIFLCTYDWELKSFRALLCLLQPQYIYMHNDKVIHQVLIFFGRIFFFKVGFLYLIVCWTHSNRSNTSIHCLCKLYKLTAAELPT